MKKNLFLKKQTIVNLNLREMILINGGIPPLNCSTQGGCGPDHGAANTRDECECGTNEQGTCDM